MLSYASRSGRIKPEGARSAQSAGRKVQRTKQRKKPEGARSAQSAGRKVQRTKLRIKPEGAKSAQFAETAKFAGNRE